MTVGMMLVVPDVGIVAGAVLLGVPVVPLEIGVVSVLDVFGLLVVVVEGQG
jgi:hypothetical protein